MESSTRRVRLIFKDKEAILTQSQKSQGFKRCWLLLKPHHQTIHHLTSHILQAFNLLPSSPHGLILSMDGFVLPPFESTGILKDKDIISVSKKPLTLALEGNNAVNKELRIMDKQPANGGALLLANEEFEKETGGYQSDEPEDESEEETEEDEDGEVHLEDRLHLEKSTGDGETSKKRKAPEEIQESKKKKQKVDESIQDYVSKKQVENAHRDAGNAKKETVCKKTKKKDGNNDKKNVELNESDTDTSSSETGSDEEGKDKSPEASKGTQKGPSRSARRKKAKRRWIREMAKIQKQANVDQPKGLKNWKQTSAPEKFERKKQNNWTEKPGNSNWKQKPENNNWKQKPVRNNWKQKPAQADSKEDDGEPKGLLHWKSLSAQDKSDDKSKDVETQYVSASEQPTQKNNTEDVVVPVVVRPGHIRFEPQEGDPENYAARQNQVSGESFQWNGITSKRKGQKWGTEKHSYNERKDDKDANGVQSHIASSSKETTLNHPIDFDKLPSLSCLPKEGDVIGYRLLELSSTWTPELSSFRVGQVSWCNPSGKLLLAPVAEFPIDFGKSGEERSDQQPDNSLYKEDGSLEIEFSTLADVRSIKDSIGGPRDTEVGGAASGGPTPMEIASSPVTPGSKDKQIQASVPGNGEVNHGNQKTATGTENVVDLWDQVSEALSAKKAELSQENSWGKPMPKPANNGPWPHRALKGSAMGPTMAFLRSKNKFRK